MEFTLLWAALLAMVPLVLALRYLGFTDSRSDLTDIVVTAAMVGLLIGRLAAMVSSGTNPLTHPADILIVRSGVATGWATVAALAWLAWAARPDWVTSADHASVASLIGLAGWHGGCVVRGSCLGTTSDLPWAISLDGSSVTRHPVEIYAMLGFLAAAAILWALARRSPSLGTGRFAAIALATAGVVRIATEPLRPALGAGPVPWYVGAIVVGVGAAALAGRRVSAPRAP